IAESRGSEADFRKAVLTAYRDRVARRREPGGVKFLLASGTGATLSPDSGVRDAEFVVAIDVSDGAVRLQPSEPMIRIASRVEPEWLRPTASEVVHRYDAATGRVKAARVERYDALVLAEHPVAADPEMAAGLLAAAWLERSTRDPADDVRQFLRRIAFAGG